MLYEKYEPPVTRSQVSACVPGEPTGDLSHGAHPGEGGGNGRVTETMTITKTVTLNETDTETHSGPWLCGRTLYSQEIGKRPSLWG